MVKILSQSGISLADAYNVEGSIAGVEQLNSSEVQLVHEMGGTIFSERFRTTVRFAEETGMAQSTAFNLVTTNLPVTISRLLAVAVVSDDATRIANATISVRDPISAGGMEVPVWVYENPKFTVARFIDRGSSVTFNLLQPFPGTVFLPTFIGGINQGPVPVNEIVLRGATAAFGAGTVFIRVFYYIAFPFLGGISSFGLPIPSW